MPSQGFDDIGEPINATPEEPTDTQEPPDIILSTSYILHCHILGARTETILSSDDVKQLGLESYEFALLQVQPLSCTPISSSNNKVFCK